MNNAIQLGQTKEKNEGIIRKINYLCFLFYFLLIFEGVLRKWVFPQLSSALFFIKDPVVLAIYWLCFYYRLFPRTKLMAISLFLAIAFFFLCLVQALVLTFPIAISIYGYRCYFFYLPMAFIMEKHFRYEDLIRFAKFTCYIAIPIAILTYIQYLSSPFSYINKNVGMSEGQAFVVARGVVRPYGPFSFVSGMAFFTPSLISMLALNFFLKEKFLTRFWFIVCIFAFFSNLAVSGSRATYGAVLIVLAFIFLGSLLLINHKSGLKTIGYLFAGFLLALILYSTIFSNQWELIVERNEIASGSEGSPIKRFLYNFINVEELDPSIGFLGAGVGMGSMGGALLFSGNATMALGETEWTRVLAESGVFFGILYILLRIAFSVYIFIEACKAVLKSKNPVPMIFVGFIIFNLLVGQMTMNGTNYAYGWLFFGFSMAINKVFQNEDSSLFNS